VVAVFVERHYSSGSGGGVGITDVVAVVVEDIRQLLAVVV
jgi:hypothetical protein